MVRGCDVLVATAGRLMHFTYRKVTCLSEVSYLVVDKADRMRHGLCAADPAHLKDPEMPPVGARQTMMFRAIFTRSIQKLASDFMKGYAFITVKKDGSTVDSTSQHLLGRREPEEGGDPRRLHAAKGAQGGRLC